MNARRFAAAFRAVFAALAGAAADEEQRLALAGVRFGTGVLVRGADRISAGKGVFIDHRAYLNSSTVNDRRGFIRIGNNVEIGPYCVLWGGGGIEIGDGVHLGAQTD